MRDLTIIGKILIVKSLALSNLVYQVGLLSIPKDFIKEVQTEIDKFIWGSSIFKVKKEVIMKKTFEGGLKYPIFDLQIKAIKLTWIKRFLNNYESKWKHLFQSLFKHI